MGLSRRAYAAHRGVSEAAVRKAIATGRITLEPDGTIDPVKADAQWDAHTDPAKQRGKHARQLGLEADAGGTAEAAEEAKPQPAMKPVPQAAIDAVNDTLRDTGEVPGDGGGGGQVSFLRARMANEILKAQTARVRLQKMKGELVDRAKATGVVKVRFVDPPKGVLPDMAARISFLRQQVSPEALSEGPTLRVPASAVVERDGAPVVLTVEGDRIREVPVKPTGRAGEEVVLEEGPKPGTQVVLAPGEGLKAGKRVRVQQEGGA